MSLRKGFNMGAVLFVPCCKAMRVWQNMFSHHDTGCCSNIAQTTGSLRFLGLRLITKSCSMWGDYTRGETEMDDVSSG